MVPCFFEEIHHSEIVLIYNLDADAFMRLAAWFSYGKGIIAYLGDRPHLVWAIQLGCFSANINLGIG